MELADAIERREALALAALARALRGEPVHWLAASERQAATARETLRLALARLGLGADAVRCAVVREVAFDYLRDRLQLGPRVRRLQGMIERLSGDGVASEAGKLRLAGLHCALVEDADQIMLDEAQSPLVITAEPDLAGDRLLLDQARELAAALSEEDFVVEDEGVRLTAEGTRRLAQLCVLLGAPWTAPARREELVVAALGAQHLGREANRGSDVLMRLSMPRFLSRYLHLAGACRDARGIEAEFWSLYGLRTRRAGPAAAGLATRFRVFRGSGQRREALLEALQARRGAARVAVRNKEEAEALRAAGVPESALLLYPAHRDAAPAAERPLIFAELHDGSRQLDQVAQACGSAHCELLLALEDKAVQAALGPLAAWAARFFREEELPPQAAAWLGRQALKGAGRAQAQMRKDIVTRERQLDELLAFSGGS